MSGGVKVVFGGAGIRNGATLGDAATLKKVYDVLESSGCTTIDTAALYGESEEILGKTGAPQRFTIDTKSYGGFNPNGGATGANTRKDVKNSQERLGANVDVYYLHAPDANTPIAETLAAINEAHRSGFFKRFGLSNFRAADVQKVYEHCKAQGYVLPTVYQGNYSAIARRQEELLFPTLRQLGLSFYAYSPLAGGFLTKSKEDIAAGAGRFQAGTPQGDMYLTMYKKPSFLEALADWEEIAREEGSTKSELAYRWVRYNSGLKPAHGDAIIIGASSLDQLKQTLSSIDAGPLSDRAVKRIDELWKKIEADAPLDNYHLNSV